MKRATYLILIYQFMLLCVPFATYKLGPFWAEIYYNQFVYPTPDISWKTSYATWDACHYLFVADHGYFNGSLSNRYLPLFPAILRIAIKALNTDAILTGLALSNVFSFLAFIFLFKFVKERFNPETAWVCLGYILSFPSSFFFTRIYAESLFLLLAVLFFCYLYRNRFGIASICASLLVLTRLTGILILVPFFVYHITFRDSRTHSVISRIVNRRLIYIFFPLITLGVAMLYMRIFTGNWFVLFTEQQSRYSILNILNVPRWFNENFINVDLEFHGITNSLIDRLAFVFYCALLWRIYLKQDKTLFVYALVMGLIPALSDHFMSYTRMLIVIFPLFIELGRTKFNHVRMQVIMFICQIIFTIIHSRSGWIA